MYESIILQKKDMRRQYIASRKSVPEHIREFWDCKILELVLNSFCYHEYNCVLLYVSEPFEVSTVKILEQAWADGKKVAIPKCEPETKQLHFYFVSSFSDMESGLFGISEPIVSRCEPFASISRNLCIVPALAFDRSGFRLGRGGGYYDRFLHHFSGETLGLCYEQFLCDRLPAESHDKSVSFIITENGILRTAEKFQ